MVEVPWGENESWPSYRRREFRRPVTEHGAVKRYGHWFPALVLSNGSAWYFNGHWRACSDYLMANYYVNHGWERILIEAGYSLPPVPLTRTRET